jgi:alcohol dehydrogenase, propanol-preferring
MKAWVIHKICDLNVTSRPLELVDMPVPAPADQQVLLKVVCCGVCHTELDEIEGRTPPAEYPVIPGHQVIGVVEGKGANANRFNIGDRLGVAWIFSACGSCEYCRSGFENLCSEFIATGRDRNGGYAQFMVVDERFAYLIPPSFSSAEAAPLLCAGAIGYRSLRLAEVRDGQTIALAGFGASGHLVLKMARHLYPRSEIFVFARSKAGQEFARELGASWAGEINEKPPHLASAIIDTTPGWSSVVGSLLHLKPGGRLVINAIRKESQDQDSLLKLRYTEHLWMEKEIKTVANIARADVVDFLELAASIPIKPMCDPYTFEQANEALMDLKHKHVKGAKVLIVDRQEGPI